MAEMIEQHLVDEPVEKTYYILKKDLNINYISMESQDIEEYWFHDVLNNMNNPNMYLMIIENMSLGIIMNNHIAENFGYLRTISEHNEFKYYKNYKIKIVNINKEWDTSKWSYYKIRGIVNRFHDLENKNISDIEHNIHNNSWQTDLIDIEFLKSLSWGYDD
tara:strand:- start:462 stop:947 length:486 start_codon:yes stop_codon:yes gene_type:complete